MEISKTYSEGGENYHSGRPRHRMLDDRKRLIKAEYIATMLARWLPQQIESVLEFGAGFGQNLLLLPGKRKVAYEPAPFAREIAKNYRDINVVGSLPTSDAFDLILLIHSLEHTLNPFGDLVKLRKLLKIGGTLIIIVPFERNTAFIPNEPNHHLFSWTRLTLANLITEAGFELEFTLIEPRALEFRFSPLRKLSPAIWLSLIRLAGRTLRSLDVVIVAKHGRSS